MVSKNKKKVQARKRKLEKEAHQDVEVIDIDTPKKKCSKDEVKVDTSAKREHEDVIEKMDTESDNTLTILPTRQSLADQLIVAMKHKQLALVEGPIGCGKTFIVRYAADQMDLPLKTMQMGDQVDSKSIFGSYHCTEVAGQFRWKQSSFSQWLTEPCVILLEDVDMANPDVISIFVEIAASRSVQLPSGDSVSFHESARLVATSSGKGKKNSVLQGVPLRISLDPLTDMDLRRLVSKTFPRSAHLAKTLTGIFREVESVPGTSNSRPLTSTDLLRGCARVNRLSDLSVNAALFFELIDVWCLADQPERARLLCNKVAAPLTMSEDRVAFHLNLRQPNFSYDDVSCTVGRCRLPRSPSLNIAQKHRLGHTRNVLQLMERIAVCVEANEPVLLVGETGVGKTSVVQTLASTLNITLKVVNLSPTSDSDELIEGYKPTTVAHILEPFTKFYHDVFTSNFDAEKNSKFLTNIEMCLSSGRYHDYLTVVESTAQKALARKDANKDPRWAEVVVRARRIRDGLDKKAAPFAVTRGAVLEAAQEGHWLLIDEINLAPPECLDAIVHAISTEAHPNFRLFACMNPATDAGKRRLPTGVRTKFTEFYVSETSDPFQLALVVAAYLPSLKVQAVENLVEFYLKAKQQFPGSYSLRTLCRALLFAADNMFGSPERSLYEAICMAFLTNLDTDDKAKMKAAIQQKFRVDSRQPLPTPPSTEENQRFVQIEGYWIECGTELPKEDSNYVITKTVKENLAEISRIVCSGRFPVLLEGETSAGKTSIVCHLAKATGNNIVRINNHEHTDIQEYMGSYVADEGGRLVFREGALVTAVRKGYWVILDELNLAPTDVIEALNRLLDDNRELFVPELNQAIRAHPRFRLFATQNPAGTYSGRKRLSRALLSRFVVLRFNHLPLDELSSMVCTRCGIHPSAASKMIAVLSELRTKRALSGLFSARDGLMTLRDVFRWAKRMATDDTCDDWLQILVNHGYFLLAGRCRNSKDEEAVVETLQRVLKRDINVTKLFAADSPYFPKDVDTSKIVLTTGMRRMLVSTEQAWLREEAVLMVGETGGGKTSLAEAVGRGRLMTINCHERTETADLLGRLRPKEGGGFEWSDGIVIAAMRSGAPLLVDEISLAEDSVLERLNPLFEEDRSLLLSDAGVEVHAVVASKGYQMIATMNPGGDYGKKELSKALRNRFTEVWSSSCYEGDELLAIFDSRLSRHSATKDMPTPTLAARAVVGWIAEFFEKYTHVFRHAPSVRDVVACADLFSAAVSNGLSLEIAVREALAAVFLDSLASLPTRMVIDIQQVLTDANATLARLMSTPSIAANSAMEVNEESDRLSIGLLHVNHGSLAPSRPRGFSLKAPTCVSNFYRIARGLLINKPILMEGGPGCGKSSTVMALAQLTGHPITRLNLSDQTDLSDLFGSDVPVVTDDGTISFKWEDGPVLRAIKTGEWVLLDEMNLASQSVLEGLNACFDHRRVLFIAELNKSFEIPEDSQCRFFACQNPRAQGGNRRALPKSFVNRFTNIWVDDLTAEDIAFILREVDEKNILSEKQLLAMVECNARLSADDHLFGGPFSFNLRDLLRWLKLYSKTGDMSAAYELLYVSRMRKDEDAQKLRSVYEELFGEPCVAPPVVLTADKKELRVGKVSLPRLSAPASSPDLSSRLLLSSQATLIHQLATCVQMQWLSLLVGPRNSGKRATIENLATACGIKLETITLTSETDAQELIGSYEQMVDDTTLDTAKAVLCDRLLGKVSDDIMKKIRSAEDLLQLETAAELALSVLTSSSNKKCASVVEECREALEAAARSDMRFAWVDSAFVRAFVDGHWLLIEDVNLCSAAVLDRLNSCLENDGKLVVSERQSSFEPLEAHPNFRVFLSMDARNGEISRAMRNRSVELFMEERQRWNTSCQDVVSMMAATGKSVSPQIAASLSELSVERQLHFWVLLWEMNVATACRAIGIDYEDDMEEQKVPTAPTIGELATQSYLDWQVKSWNPQETNTLERPFLALLNASTSLLSTESMKAFGPDSKSFLSRLAPLVKKMSKSAHPIDARGSNGEQNADITEELLSRFVSEIVCEWARVSVEKKSASEGSAEKLSRSLTKYEMSTHDASFKNLQLIAGFVDAALKTLKDGNVQATEQKVFVFCLSLLLFIQSARRPLSSRAGCAPIYLAWNDLVNIKDVTVSPMLSKVMTLLSAGWTAEAHEQFVSQYLDLYEKHRLVEPFENEEENQRFVTLSERQVKPEDTDDVVMITYDEDDDEEKIDENRVSPIKGALELVGRMHNLMRFLATMTTDESDALFASQPALCGLKWRNDSVARFARVLAVLNASHQEDQHVSSIPLHGAFSLVYVSFWSSLQFDSSMGLLSVSDLREFALTTFTRQLWRLAPNSSPLTQRIGNELSVVAQGVSGWNSSLSNAENSWRQRISTAITMMDMALPPPETLDPVVFEEEQTRYLHTKLEMVNSQLEILAEWRANVSRQDADCDSTSRHPVISTLLSLRADLTSKLEGRTIEESPVFRQKASQYLSLCSEMRSFRSVASEVISGMTSLDLSESKLRETEEDKLRIMQAQLYSFTMSVASFKQSCLIKYSSFVDVLVSFVTAVDILLCAVHEVSAILEAATRRKELHSASAFPIMFKLRASDSGVESSELLAWCCRDGSPMPLRLKAAVMRKRIVGRIDTRVDLEWTRRQWQKWYEKNIAKAAEKDFVYRNKTEEEKDEMDVVAFFTKEEQDNEILPAGDVSLLLDALESSGGRKEAGNAASRLDRDGADTRYSMALTWIRHVLMGMGLYGREMHDATIDSDLSMLRWVGSQENSAEQVDVYRGASVKEFRRAADLLDSLEKRVKEVQERWPEVVTLKLILQSINKFTAASLTTTHMKMAAMMEMVMENCEDWEKLSDRANSVRDELAPLRELLVDWKKMEVRSWSRLLVGVEAEARMSAQLVAYPLFDALFKAETTDALAAIVAMSAEWLHHGTLLDFSARLRSIRSLAEWASELGHGHVADKLRSVAAHFSMYAPVVEQKLKEAVDPADHDLQDYIKIVKYKDLNLWNIKVSSEKAHTHLFKIIRRFKAAVAFEVEPHFDSLLNIDQYRNVEAISLELAAMDSAEGKAKRAHQLARKILENGETLCDVSPLRELTEQTEACDSALKTSINYDLYNDDEAKEKAQGYARNCRQRDVAMVIKEAQAVGLTARKACTLNQENITQMSITGIAIGRGREELVRVCAGGRNACIRTSNKASDQLGIATRKHMSGVVEYGMSWLLKLQSRISGWEQLTEQVKQKSVALDRMNSNVKTKWFIDHERLHDVFTAMGEQSSELRRLVTAMKTRLDMVPETADDIDASCSAHLHRLSLLHSTHPQMESLRQTVAHCCQLTDAMDNTAHKMAKDGDLGIYERSAVVTGIDQLGLDCVELDKSLAELEDWFENESRQARSIVKNISGKLEVKQIETSQCEASTDTALLVIQSLYKSIVDGSDEWKKVKTMERLDTAIECLENSGCAKLVPWLDSIVSDAAAGIVPSSLHEICSLSDLCTQLLSKCTALLSSVLQAVAILYHTILSMAMQLFEKGYVNTIPKDGKQESGEGKTDESGEGGGMGEGQSAGDAKDVTDEMEESGQIEGLQDEEQEPPSGKKGENDTPIEMDEDFAEDIQDIDRNEKGDDKEEEDVEDEEPEAEDQMGDVEDADDTELDPKLWDEDEKDDDRKDTDQDDKGADNETDQLAAREDDPMAVEEEEKGDKEDEAKEDGEKEEDDKGEEDEDLENMDERDRDDEHEDPSREMEKDEINQEDDADKGEDINMDEEVDGDDTDKEDEDAKEGEGEDDMMEVEDIPDDELDPSRNPAEDEEEKNEQEDSEAIEQGTGGERRQNESKEDENGGLNEDEMEDEQEKEDDEGQGKSKSDDRGDAGKGAEIKENEEAEKEEEKEGDEEEREEGADRKKELATDDQPMEEAERGEGEENETGQKMEDAAAAPRQMMGGGTMEEARQSKKDEKDKKDRPPQQRKQPLAGQEEEMDVPDEGEATDDVETQAAIHLAPEDMFTLAEGLNKELVLGESADREETESSKKHTSEERSKLDADRMWTEISRSVNILSAELAENLRLILEPQRASKMQGDYRTGKRLNMRRLIPYIASEYRKDRIWMRRTKRAQRDYQVMIAVDDSASMNENGIHQVTCESVCAIDDALRRCDAGAVSVCSFGSGVETICAFGDQMTPGPELLQKLTFDQSSTDLIGLLNRSRTQLNDARTPTSEQLLIIISDGRGALSQGAEKVRQTLATLQGVTVLFVILDSGKKAKSITELSVASFQGGSVVLTPYMSLFPFPFYAMVKQVHQLPAILAESIRQWFELTIQSSSL